MRALRLAMQDSEMHKITIRWHLLVFQVYSLSFFQKKRKRMKKIARDGEKDRKASLSLFSLYEKVKVFVECLWVIVSHRQNREITYTSVKRYFLTPEMQNISAKLTPIFLFLFFWYFSLQSHILCISQFLLLRSWHCWIFHIYEPFKHFRSKFSASASTSIISIWIGNWKLCQEC